MFGRWGRAGDLGEMGKNGDRIGWKRGGGSMGLGRLGGRRAECYTLLQNVTLFRKIFKIIAATLSCVWVGSYVIRRDLWHQLCVTACNMRVIDRCEVLRFQGVVIGTSFYRRYGP